MAARSERPDNVNEYEQKRLDRIAANQAKLGECQIGKMCHQGCAPCTHQPLITAAASLYTSFAQGSLWMPVTGCIGVLQQKSLLEASFRSVKRPATPKPAKVFTLVISGSFLLFTTSSS